MNDTTQPHATEATAVGAPVEQPVRPLPAPHYPQWSHSNEYAAWTERQVRAIVAHEVAAERERWAEMAKERMQAMTDEQRIALIDDLMKPYCKACGSKFLPCYCWRDE